MNELVTGDAYVEALNAEAPDRMARKAFVDLALTLLPAGGRIFDFGCGPGVDARTYAERGHEVCAFDIDPEMCASFRRTCASDVAAGRIHLIQRSFDSFIAGDEDAVSRVDLVTANFAPLNLVPEPAPLFRKFHGMLNPGGRVLASLLNPLHRGDLHYAWWWRGLPALLLRGHFAVPGSQAPISRWLPSRLAREAAPCFEVESLGVPAAWRDPVERVGVRIITSARDWLAAGSARFLFLVLRKRMPPA